MLPRPPDVYSAAILFYTILEVLQPKWQLMCIAHMPANTKHEYLNSKQIQNPNDQRIKEVKVLRIMLLQI
jgi:hypothetical protein